MSFIISSSSSSSSSSSESSTDDKILESFINEFQKEFLQDLTKKRRKPNKPRRRENGHELLYGDYFAENPVYNDEDFRRRFRMRRHVFLRIVESLENYSPYFRQKHDAIGIPGLSPLQKCTAAIRMLAYGMSADAVDEYLRIGESTAMECLKRFVKGIIAVFGEEYLRRPNPTDMERLLYIGEKRGFPGMLGSIDCMHWEWKNCPKAWKGQFARGDHGKATIILEAVASYDLWIWHAFFGVPGTCNDINVLNRSPVFDDVLEGRSPPVQYIVNDHQYNLGYYLTDGIYPPWATFIQSISLPQGNKAQLFAKFQESARKDVERAFGVLQARFAMIRGPSRIWSMKVMGEIMRACIIMHNMIIEDERDTYEHYDDILKYHQIDNEGESSSRWEYSSERISEYETYIQNRIRVHDRQAHQQLKADLVENIWEKFGSDST